MLIDPKAVLFFLGSSMDYRDRLACRRVSCSSTPTRPRPAAAARAWRSRRPAPSRRRRRRASPAMDAEALKELFSPIGAVAVRRMFGGKGVYADELMFAMAMGGEVYLKCDARPEPVAEADRRLIFWAIRAGEVMPAPWSPALTTMTTNSSAGGTWRLARRCGPRRRKRQIQARQSKAAGGADEERRKRSGARLSPPRRPSLDAA